MTIHEAAEQTGLKEANIRFYEKEGLLCPKRNAGNQYRSYTQDDLKELKRIRLFRLLGFSCAEIAQLQRGDLALPDALERRQTALKEEAEENRRLLLLCEQLRQAEAYHAVSPELVEQKLPLPEEKQKAVLSVDQKRFGWAMALSALAALGLQRRPAVCWSCADMPGMPAFMPRTTLSWGPGWCCSSLFCCCR